MNQTAPRCIQCQENPRIFLGKLERGPEYHPLCQDCHEVLRERCRRESAVIVTSKSGVHILFPYKNDRSGEILPENKLTGLKKLTRETRFIGIGLAAAATFQIPLLIAAGSVWVAIFQGVLGVLGACWAAAGFRLRRRS